MVAASWLCAAALWQRAAFRMSMRGGGLAAASYLLRLSLSPTATRTGRKLRRRAAGGSGTPCCGLYD
jgi:hypothetical protein